MLALGDLQLEGDRATNDFIRRGLVHAAGIVAARPDAGHVAARRNEIRLAGEGVEDFDPGPVEGGVLRVVAGLIDPPFADLLRVQPGRRVENRDPVSHQLTVGDHRQLHRLDLVSVDHAALVRGHQVGHAEHRDGVDGFETGKSGAVGRIAHVLVRGGRPEA